MLPRSASMTSGSSELVELMLVSLALAKDQLPPVGVMSPSPLWKSPKSPKLSNDVSSSDTEVKEKCSLSRGGAAAASENGPN